MSDEVNDLRGTINSLGDIGGADCTTAYYVRGHVDKEAFRRALLLDYGERCDVETIKHEYMRWTPAPKGSEFDQLAQRVMSPGRGAFAVTILHTP
jgi:hypothetical protein